MLHLGWIFATQVCREWRKVALGCKTLWTYIDPAVLGEEWSREMLRRSNGVPLTLRHTSSSLIHGKLRKFTLKLPTRPKVRALEVDLERFHVANDTTLDQLEKIQPHLERLEFHAHESVPTIDRSDYFRMPLTWLGGASAPQLRWFSLLNVIPAWNSPIFTTSALTSLSIGFSCSAAFEESRREIESRVRTPAEQLLSTLRILSHSLEDLELQNCMPLQWPVRTAGAPLVVLPRLESLKVTCDILDDVLRFYEQLVLGKALSVLHIDATRIGPLFDTPELAYDRVFGLVQSLCFPASVISKSIFNELLFKYTHHGSTPYDNTATSTLMIHLGSGILPRPLPSLPLPGCIRPPEVRLSLPIPDRLNDKVANVTLLRLIDIVPANWKTVKTLAMYSAYPSHNFFVGPRPSFRWSIQDTENVVERLSGLQNVLCGHQVADKFLDTLLKINRLESQPLPSSLDHVNTGDISARQRACLPGLQRLFLFEPDLSRTLTVEKRLGNTNDTITLPGQERTQLRKKLPRVSEDQSGSTTGTLTRLIDGRRGLGSTLGAVHLLVTKATSRTDIERVRNTLERSAGTEIIVENVEDTQFWAIAKRDD